MNIGIISADLVKALKTGVIVPAEILAEIKGMKETTAAREARIDQAYKAKLKNWEENLRAEINLNLICDGKYDNCFFSDKQNYLREDIVKICDKIAKEFKAKGYFVCNTIYDESKRSRICSLYIKL